MKDSDRYFALINCQADGIVHATINANFIGSLFDSSDSWRIFRACKKDLPSLEDIASGRLKGVVITGSGESAYSKKDWIVHFKDWLATAVSFKNVKIVGTCFGHQMLAEALGGAVEPRKGGTNVLKAEIIYLGS